MLCGLTVVLAVGVGAIALMGVDGFMIRGVAAGGISGLALMLLGWFTTLRGIRAGKRSDALAHVLGGFMVRLVVLAAGFFLLAFTGWGNAAGFAVAFLMAVMVYLSAQVLAAARSMQLKTA